MKQQPSNGRQTREPGKSPASPLSNADISRRIFNDMVGFWQVCERPACRRNHACSGDMHACFARLWPLVPESEKEYVRGCIVAAQTTRSRQAIHRAGIAARDEQLKRQAQIDPRLAAPAAANSAPATTAAPARDVRVRRL